MEWSGGGYEYASSHSDVMHATVNHLYAFTDGYTGEFAVSIPSVGQVQLPRRLRQAPALRVPEGPSR